MNVRTTVLGIGNVLLCDEGAGVHALDALHKRCTGDPALSFIDGGTLSFTLAGTVEGAESLVVLDAANLGGVPGTVAVFEGEEMDRFLSGNRGRNVHEVALLDVLAIAALTCGLPERRALIGIQPGSVDWGERPTADVARGIERVCDLAQTLIARWRAAAAVLEEAS